MPLAQVSKQYSLKEKIGLVLFFMHSLVGRKVYLYAYISSNALQGFLSLVSSPEVLSALLSQP